MEQNNTAVSERFMSVSDREAKLIEHIRMLKFDEMCSAVVGINSECERDKVRSLVAASNGYKAYAADCAKGAENLKVLSQLLAESNDDYYQEITYWATPEDREDAECRIN